MQRQLLLSGLAALCFVFPRTAAAYPIPPETLWGLTEKADVVVLATVKEVKPRKAAGTDDWDASDRAVLVVKEIWKGPRAQELNKELNVDFGAHIMCPAPARFEPLLDVLTFLSRSADGKSLQVVGLSYGTLYPEVRDVPAFRRLVKDAVAIQASKDPMATAGRRVDWLVGAAEEPATRWHGVYELDSSADRLHAFYDTEPRTTRQSLDDQQVERLRRAFVERPVLDGTLPMLLKLLGDRPSAEVDRTAVAAIDTILQADNPPYWSADLIALTRVRLGLKAPPTRTHRPKDKAGMFDIEADPIFWPGSDPVASRKEWAAIRRKLPFPNRLLSWPGRATVRGVGVDSPP